MIICGAMPPRTANCPIFRLAKQQEGVVSNQQLRQLGVTQKCRRIRLQSGEWINVLPTVVRLYWADETWMQRVWAASLWLGERGCISHYTAALLGGFTTASPDAICVISTEPLRSAPEWMAVYRARTVPEMMHVSGGIRITSPVQTLINLAAILDELALEKLMYEACRQRFVSLTQLGEAIPRLTRQGKPGRGRLRRAVANLSNSLADRHHNAA